MAQTSLIVHRPGDRGPVDDLAREKAERRRDTLRGGRQPRQACAGRVGDGIGDGGGRRADGRLADAARAEGAEPSPASTTMGSTSGTSAALGMRYEAKEVVRLMPSSTITSSMSP